MCIAVATSVQAYPIQPIRGCFIILGYINDKSELSGEFTEDFSPATPPYIGLTPSFRGIYGKCLCEGDLQRERVGYTATEQWTPVATYFIGFLLVVVGGTLGLKGEQCITSGLNTMFTSKFIFSVKATIMAVPAVHVNMIWLSALSFMQREQIACSCLRSSWAYFGGWY